MDCKSSPHAGDWLWKRNNDNAKVMAPPCLCLEREESEHKNCSHRPARSRGSLCRDAPCQMRSTALRATASPFGGIGNSRFLLEELVDRISPQDRLLRLLAELLINRI